MVAQQILILLAKVRIFPELPNLLKARVEKLVNSADLKSAAEKLVGSSPTTRTILNNKRYIII